MIAVCWADVGCPNEPGEREVAGITVVIGWEHIEKWKEDPDGVWEVEKVSPSRAGLGRRYTLDQWHPTQSLL